MTIYGTVKMKSSQLNLRIISAFILLHEKFLQSDWLRALVFQLNLKYLHVKIFFRGILECIARNVAP